VVPRLWRSELRNILASCLRADQMDGADAALIFQRAAELIGVEKYEVETTDVLRLSQQGRCPACDCEVVALAEFLDLTLVTADTQIMNAFPRRTSLLGAG
jgi:predicted nucleic acid-binding protein